MDDIAVVSAPHRRFAAMRDDGRYWSYRVAGRPDIKERFVLLALRELAECCQCLTPSDHAANEQRAASYHHHPCCT